MPHSVLVRLDDEQHAALLLALERDGLTAAAMMRQALKEALNEEPSAPRLGNEPPMTGLTRLDRVRLAETATHVGRLTGALIQSAKAMREYGRNPVLHAEIEQSLIEVRSLLVSLRDILAENAQ